MGSDSFVRYCSKAIKKPKKKQPWGYLIKGMRLNKEEMNVIIGTMPLSQIKELAKAKNVTITIYLATVLIQSIYKENFLYHKKNKPIMICIPIDLRKYFPSTSMNNFFTTATVGVNLYDKHLSFEEISKSISEQLKEGLTEDNLANQFRWYVTLQNNIFLRFIPLFIKTYILRILTNIIGGNNTTSTLSNLGIVEVPKELKRYIDKFDAISYPDRYMPLKVAFTTYEDNLSFVFASFLNDTEIQRNFFTYLTKQGVDVKVSFSISDYKKDGGKK
jgi:NRPS condensation-like uncharacterized protein